MKTNLKYVIGAVIAVGLIASMAAVTGIFYDLVSQLPNVDVRSQAFSVGCSGNADPTGTTDSTCQINNAITFIETFPVFSSGNPVLYLPGNFKITAALRIPCNITVAGNGVTSSQLTQVSTTANAITFIAAQGGTTDPYLCGGELHDITIAGTGHLGSGTLVEVDNAFGMTFKNLQFYNGGGRGLTFNGASEREYGENIKLDVIRYPMQLAGSTNEERFHNISVEGGGSDASGYCWSVNCVSGVYPSSGVIVPDMHASIYVNGTDVEFDGGSIKPTQYQAGFQIAYAEATSIRHYYIEGFPFSNQPRLSPAIIAGGVLPKTTTTAVLNTTSFPTSAAVTDTKWFTTYVNDPADIGAGIGYYAIFCADAAPGSTTPCAANSSVQQGQWEIVTGTMAGDGALHAKTHFSGAVSGIAWASGSIVKQVLGSTSLYSSFFGHNALTIADNHIEAIANPGSGYTANCVDQTPTLTCADIVAGFPPDNLAYSPLGTSGPHVPASVTMSFLDNSFFVGTETTGGGYVKIHSRASINDLSMGPLGSSENEEVVTGILSQSPTFKYQSILYNTGTPTYAALSLGSGSLNLGTDSGNFLSSLSAFDSMLEPSGYANGYQYANSACWYDTALSTGANHSTTKFCLTGGPTGSAGFAYYTWSGSAWVVQMQCANANCLVATTQALGDSSTKIADTQYVRNQAQAFKITSGICTTPNTAGAYCTFNVSFSNANLYAISCSAQPPTSTTGTIVPAVTPYISGQTSSLFVITLQNGQGSSVGSNTTPEIDCNANAF